MSEVKGKVCEVRIERWSCVVRGTGCVVRRTVCEVRGWETVIF